MKKLSAVKKLAAVALAAGMTLSAAACGSSSGPVGEYDNEKDPVVFSSQAVDQVFSPFYSTTGPDGSVVGMTQISMLANDENGNPAYGEDEPVVTLDMEVVKEGEREDVDLFTTYYFVLKNNVKFSNGSPLTIKDVLFNYYLYLDPVYTGSTTIYSTDIVGLAEYRTQQTSEDEQKAFMKQFETAATARIDDLRYIAEEIKKTNPASESAFRSALATYDGTSSNYSHLLEDYDKAIELFKEELETDYSNSLDSYEDTVFTGKDGTTYRNLLKSDVEQFLYNEGYITWNKNEAVEHDGGNVTYGALSTSAALNMDALRAQNWDKKKAIDFVYNANVPDNISEIITYWMTASNLHTYITYQELEEYSKNNPAQIPNISGIQFANRTGSVKVNGKTYGVPEYDETDGSVKDGFNEVLSIKIKNVDPKAIWNFALTVAPMYYYSDAEHIAAFDFESNFGVERASQTWYDARKTATVDVPVGAGPYVASNSTSAGVYDAEGKMTVPASGSFCVGGSMIYFERNPYYVGGLAKIKKLVFQVSSASQMTSALYTGEMDFVEPNSTPELEKELKNSKTKYIDNDCVVDYKSIPTLGYGYIGVNAGKVPSIYVRRAIMHAIDTQKCISYYQGGAEAIYRPMSKQSWAYPKDAVAYYPYIGGKIPELTNDIYPYYKQYVEALGKKKGDTLTDAEQKEYIRMLVEDEAGYKLNGNGVYQNGSDVLKYTFTIVGEDNNHPAWNALFLAGQFLNGCGFEINTKTDANGLKKLNTGDLAVWAAAWGSTIDPDMYQVYHKESTATSVLNWGYKQILMNVGGKYDEELGFVEDLSDLIDEARKVDDSDAAGRKERTNIYADALDLVMKLAVELPTYQRNDLFAYNTYKIDVKSFFQNPTAFKGLTSDIHLLSLNLAK